MDAILQELRYAARTLAKNPGFAALTVACLALGIGVNSTIFSVVDTVSILPLPFGDPERLVELATTQHANGVDRGNVSYLDQQNWKARTRSFAEISAVSGRFGVVALALASIGVYGVLSYAVAQRTQEIGVRMALGATRQNVFALIVAHGARLAAIGILCGVVGAAAVTRVVASLLYNVSATDPISFLGTAAFLGFVALIASYIPARRATGVDPLVALRAQ
jgi:ABC-type antimicrobial peptide transport system permease subunit